MDPLVARARDFARRMHRSIDHRRKYTHEPYEVHLEAVAGIVATVTDDPEMIAAAWLHDVVEDTPVTLEEIRAAFGQGVADLVEELTDVSRPHHGSRAARKALDREHTARSSARAKTVKLADLLHNLRDIATHDPHFGLVFLRETRALLPHLAEGDPRLYERLAREADETARRLKRQPSPVQA